MRVSMKYNKIATPCEVFTYGEVEDYTVNVGSGKSVTPSYYENTIIANVSAKIYPNPASGETTLELTSEEITTISYKLIDLQGRVLITKDEIQVNGYHEEKINIEDINKGIYFIMIYNENMNESYKLIVE
jgi:hypothetical protein